MSDSIQNIENDMRDEAVSRQDTLPAVAESLIDYADRLKALREVMERDVASLDEAVAELRDLSLQLVTDLAAERAKNLRA
jgi:hypothetical protein